MTLATWGAATGMASSAVDTTGCTDSNLSTAFPAKDCSASPAAMMGLGGTGYPCFRDGALPVVMLATDEAPWRGAGTHTARRSRPPLPR